MVKTFPRVLLCVVLIFMLLGCGGLRYSQVAPGSKEFHPKTIGILPVDVGTHGEARGVVDRILADIITKKGWFSYVVSPEEIEGKITSDSALRKAVVEYLTKLKTVNFSDPDLSNTIGRSYTVDAFAVVYVDFWDYTVEGDDKVAKVGFSVSLVDAPTGKIMWEAGHHEVEDYLLFKPDLAKVAHDVAKTMIGYMPH